MYACMVDGAQPPIADLEPPIFLRDVPGHLCHRVVTLIEKGCHLRVVSLLMGVPAELFFFFLLELSGG
jgi:hypothetical protein